MPTKQKMALNWPEVVTMRERLFLIKLFDLGYMSVQAVDDAIDWAPYRRLFNKHFGRKLSMPDFIDAMNQTANRANPQKEV